MDFESLIKKYSDGEPIFINEIPCKSKNYLRQEFKKYTDNGLLVRLYNGVYYKKYKTILGTDGKISINKFVNKAYMNNNEGYLTGLTLANKYGFTTQNPSVIEVCSNKATTKQRKLNIDGYSIIVYQPAVDINEYNKATLQFLDLMTSINKISEIKGEELLIKIKEYIKATNVDFNCVKKYINKYPPVVYKNIYDLGLMYELV